MYKMAVYNTSFMDNATGLLDLVKGLGSTIATENNVSSYIFGNSILGMIFILTLIFFLNKEDTIEATVISSIITVFAAIFLATTGLILWSIVVWPFIIFLVSVILFFMK